MSDQEKDASGINTDGGAYIGGNVNTNGGDFVGRDKTVQGDEVHGDKVMGDKIMGDKVDKKVEGDQISVGNIEGSQGIAIGRGAEAHVSIQQGATGAELVQLLSPLRSEIEKIDNKDALAALNAKVTALEAEVSKGDEAEDDKMANLIQDVAELAPSVVETLVGLFTSSALAKLAGGATKFVIGRIK